MKTVSTAAVVVLATAQCWGVVIMVDDDGAADFSNIQAAIDAAAAGDELVVRPGVYRGAGNRDISFLGKAIMVRGTDPNDPCAVAATVIDCNGTAKEYHRGFIFDSGEDSNSVLDGLTIAYGFADAGGGIYCEASGPSIRNCTLRRNTSDPNDALDATYGGAMYNIDGEPRLVGCRFVANRANNDDWRSGYGGAICNVGGSVRLERCEFVENKADNAGAIYSYSNNTVLSECAFTSNKANGWDYPGCEGGAIFSEYGILELSECNFEDNHAPYGGLGGAVCNFETTGTVTGCTFVGNGTYIYGLQLGDGGAIYSSDGDLEIYGCRFLDNVAGWEGYGGGIYAYDGTIRIRESHFEGNDAYNSGGGVLLRGQVEVTRCDFIDNYSEGPGGGMSAGNAVVSHCVFKDNYSGNELAGGGGADVWNSEFEGCVFAANSASGTGGLECGGNTTVSECTFVRNAGYVGGIANVSAGTVKVTNCILWNNRGEVSSQLAIDTEPNYCCIEGWTGGGAGNIVSDPRFAAEEDYRLKSEYGRWSPDLQRWVYDDVTSPCIDAGDPCSDWTGELWPNGGRINMGAYGGTAEASMSGAGVGRGADIDNNGMINLGEYCVVAGQWYAGQARTIPRGSVTVDGDLSDWAEDAPWVAMDEIYYGEPCDVNSAKFALCWDEESNKIYAAVVVADSEHCFTDEYVSWNAGDRLEIYSQGSAAGGGGFWHWENPEWDSAQQYMVGPDTIGGHWASWGTGGELAEDIRLEYAVCVNGATIVYEIGVRAFENYGGITGEPTVETQLGIGEVVGFDLVVDSRWSGGFGMLSENLMLEKYKNADSFRLCTVSGYVLAPADGPLKGDVNRDQVVDWYDVQAIVEAWLE